MARGSETHKFLDPHVSLSFTRGDAAGTFRKAPNASGANETPSCPVPPRPWGPRRDSSLRAEDTSLTPGHLPLPLGATCGTSLCGQRRHQPCPRARKAGPPAPDRRPRTGHVGDAARAISATTQVTYKAGPFSMSPELCSRPCEFEFLTICSSSRPPTPSAVTPTCRPLLTPRNRALPSDSGPFR